VIVCGLDRLVAADLTLALVATIIGADLPVVATALVAMNTGMAIATAALGAVILTGVARTAAMDARRPDVALLWMSLVLEGAGTTIRTAGTMDHLLIPMPTDAPTTAHPRVTSVVASLVMDRVREATPVKTTAGAVLLALAAAAVAVALATGNLAALSATCGTLFTTRGSGGVLAW
jgi:hypothetical protein